MVFSLPLISEYENRKPIKRTITKKLKMEIRTKTLKNSGDFSPARLKVSLLLNNGRND